jgi:hypothetical protein
VKRRIITNPLHVSEKIANTSLSVKWFSIRSFISLTTCPPRESSISNLNSVKFPTFAGLQQQFEREPRRLKLAVEVEA